jgi:TRAP-type C4-dicarboxylate transport system permease small subunit
VTNKNERDLADDEQTTSGGFVSTVIPQSEGEPSSTVGGQSHRRGGSGALLRTVAVLSWLARRGGDAAAVGTLILLVTFIAAVSARYFFNKPIIFTDEFATYVMAGVAALGFGYTLMAGGHISMDVLGDRLRPRPRSVLRVTRTVLGLFFVITVIVAGFSFCWYEFREHVTSTGFLPVAIWIPASVLPIAGILLFCGWVNELMQALSEYKAIRHK